MSDKMIRKHRLTGPFIDVGGGRGDVSLHYAKNGWSGVLVDRSPEAVATAKTTLSDYSEQVSIQHGEANQIDDTFNTAFLFDVLEHVEEDSQLLSDIGNKLNPGGALIISVPTKPAEWRWDDDFYGHIRRYEPQALINLLVENGYRVESSVDITFPFFWGIRRFYTRVLKPRHNEELEVLRRTEISSLNNSWRIPLVVDWISQMTFLWWPVMLIQMLFKNTAYGCERLIVARKNR